jgi:hypothetical protein
VITGCSSISSTAVLLRHRWRLPSSERTESTTPNSQDAVPRQPGSAAEVHRHSTAAFACVALPARSDSSAMCRTVGNADTFRAGDRALVLRPGLRLTLSLVRRRKRDVPICTSFH